MENNSENKKYIIFNVLVILSLFLLCTYLIVNIIYYFGLIKVGNFADFFINSIGITYVITYFLILFAIILFLILYIFRFLRKHKIFKNVTISLLCFIILIYLIQQFVLKLLFYLDGSSLYLSTIITTAICISLLIASYVIFLIKTIKNNDFKFLKYIFLIFLISIITYLILHTILIFQLINEYTSFINYMENDLFVSIYKVLILANVFESTTILMTLVCVIIFTIIYLLLMIKSKNLSKTLILSLLLIMTFISFIRLFTTSVILFSNESTSAPYYLYMIIISSLCAISFIALYSYCLFLQRKYQNIQTDQTRGST